MGEMRIAAAALVLGFCVFPSRSQSPGDSVGLKDGLDSVSYIIGRDVGSQLNEFGARIRMAPFSFGVRQAIRKAPSLIDSARADSIRRAFAGQVQEHIQQQTQEQAEQNRKTADSLLSRNRKQAGIKVTKSGLQYRELKRGRGPRPSASDSVRVMYKGTTADSTVFDSTSQPVVLNLGTTIPGLAEGIQLMNVGSRYRFFIPPSLGYGMQGAPPAIPPNSLLIFDVELSGIAGRERK